MFMNIVDEQSVAVLIAERDQLLAGNRFLGARLEQLASEMAKLVGENERLRWMLETVIDASYGTSGHDVGNGDGISEAKAKEISEWWQRRLVDIEQKGEQ